MKPAGAKIPIILLTGFLGSGKTTLLRELLAHPQMTDTAIVINELGEVGLDHHLVQGATESMLVLENGCICCSVRDDLVGVLSDLFWNRLHRSIPFFSRVIIETTGVASPGPIAEILLSDPLLGERYRLDAIVTTVDSVLGADQLDRHWETMQQVTAADLLLLTKPDLADAAQLARLDETLAALNPLAERRQVAHGRIAPEILLLAHREARPPGGKPAPPAPPRPRGPLGLHGQDMTHFTIRFHASLVRNAFLAALSEVLRRFGGNVLRVKGLVSLAGETAPFVVQAVGTTLFPLQALPAWPDGEPAPALVFIVSGIDAGDVYETLERAAPGIVA